MTRKCSFLLHPWLCTVFPYKEEDDINTHKWQEQESHYYVSSLVLACMHMPWRKIHESSLKGMRSYHYKTFKWLWYARSNFLSHFQLATMQTTKLPFSIDCVGEKSGKGKTFPLNGTTAEHDELTSPKKKYITGHMCWLCSFLQHVS